MSFSSLPTSPAPRSGDYVSLDQFFSAYNAFSRQVRRRIFKLERLQNYLEPDNESWREFRAGNIQRSLELIPQIRAKEADSDVEFFRRGLQFLRVRTVELPLSPYIEWEFEFHAISAQYGETILVSNLTDVDRKGVLWGASDFLLFDSFAVLVHDYNSDGLLRGGWVCQEGSAISHYTDLANQFISISVPLAVFMVKHASRYNTASRR
jgi:hypothetical protein